MIRVLICDDQEVVREGLATILSTAQGIQVVGAAPDGARAMEMIAELKPDIVLMDLNMPLVNGIEATRQMYDQFPTVRVLVLTTYETEEWVLDAIRAGAVGYLLKDTPRANLIRAIEGTYTGQSYLDPGVAGKIIAQVANPGSRADTTLTKDLSLREREVLRLLARGKSNSDIASLLFLTEGTVRNYVSSIFSKLNVSDRTQAAVIALRHGLAD
jgi:two-component system, NarL family, response regulator LiaR